MTRALAFVASIFVLVGCSEDPEAKNAQPVDSGATDTGVIDATTDSGSDSSIDSGAPTDSATDTTADASDAPMACVGDAGPDADAAPLCPAGEWMDYEDGSCSACPAKPITCARLYASMVDYDTSTRRLTLALDISTTQLVSGNVKISYTSDSCTSTGPGTGATVSTANLPIEVKDDVFYVDLSAVGIASVRPCGSFTLTALDACCTTHTVTFDVFYDDASSSVSLSCPVTDGG